MEYVSSKMVDELIGNASSFAGLSVNVFVDLSVEKLYFCFRVFKMKFNGGIFYVEAFCD